MKLLPQSRARCFRSYAGVLAVGVLASGVAAVTLGSAAWASPAAHHAAAVSYHFRTLNSSNDETFNQLLGINSHGRIAGYFGSGAQGHKNKGYTIVPPYKQRNYRTENFPGSAQTQVTGLNDTGITVGFYSRTNKANPAANANFGFYAIHGAHFRSVNFPTTNNSSPPVNQLLGVNDHGIAVGFYTDSAGNAHGYKYAIATGHFSTVTVPGATSVTAAAINNKGGVAGFFTDSHGTVRAFLIRPSGTLIILARAGAGMTQAFGLNDNGEVVGAYTAGTASHGFTWTIQHGFRTVDDPKGIGTTLINGVNDAGDLVGFYTDGKGNTDGMLATP